MLGSLALHAGWVGVTWTVVEPRKVVVADRTTRPERRPTPPLPIDPVRLGSGGEGRGVLASDGAIDQVAEESFQEQPLLAVAPAPPSARPVDAGDFQAIDAQPILPPMQTGGQMAAMLSPPPQPAEAEAEPTPALPPSDRDSTPTSEAPETVAEVRGGRVVSRHGIDFKLVGVRTNLSAFIDGAFIAPGTRVKARIVVDDEGRPLQVTIEQSSGSDAVDQALRAIYFNSTFGYEPGKPHVFTLILNG